MDLFIFKNPRPKNVTEEPLKFISSSSTPIGTGHSEKQQSETKMGCFSYNPFTSPPPCQVQVTGSLSSQFKTASPPLKQLPSLFKQQKKQSISCQRAAKVVSYYALKTPSYKLDALEPHMSKKTLEVHWGEHHRAYVDGLNAALGKSDILYGLTLDELLKVTYNNGNPLPEFNNAAQVWNHDFFWDSMQPGGGNVPELGVLEQIEKDFGSFTNFRDKFTETALTQFGSGWVWLVLKREEKRLEVVKTSNAVTPLVWGDIAIIGLDMWEHAYYLDYKNDRESYVNAFMNHLVSWNMAMARMARAEAFVNLGEPKIPIA